MTVTHAESVTGLPSFELSIDGRAAPEVVLQRVTEIVVTAEPNTLDTARIVLANPFPDLPFTHGDQAGAFVEGRKLAVAAGARSGTARIFEGEITSIASRLPRAQEAATVTVEAFSLLHRLADAPRTHAYQQQSDSDIASLIASRHGLSADVDRSQPIHPLALQVNEDDLSYLLARARAINYDLRVEGSRLTFKKASSARNVAMAVAWGSGLEEIELRVNARRPVAKATVHGQEPINREKIAAEAAAGPKLASGADPAFPDREAVVVDRPVLSAAEAGVLAQALYDELSRELVQADGTMVGTPELRPGVLVRLTEIGKRFVGDYEVTRTTHRLSPGDYRTSFSARSGKVGRA
jgi:phage protein D